MKFGIDTFGCEHGLSGLGSYLKSLSACLPDSDGTQWNFFGHEIDRYTYSTGGAKTYTAVRIRDTARAQRIWHRLFANSFMRRQKYDAVLFAAAQVMPERVRVPSVAVVSGPLSQDSNIAALANADIIVAPSKFVQKDLSFHGLDEEKIQVVHNGIDHSVFFPKPEIQEEALDIHPFAIKRPYFIYASKINHAEKKHVELIRAFTLFKKKTGLPHRLVLAGTQGDCADSVSRAAFESEAANDIFITGYYPFESLPNLYAASEGCVFPSVIEGVGLPVLEAMAMGIPVACANSGALPELTGGNALLFDPDNIREAASAMERMALDTELRAKMSEEGAEWSNRFNWKLTADEILRVMRKAAEGGFRKKDQGQHL